MLLPLSLFVDETYILDDEFIILLNLLNKHTRPWRYTIDGSPEPWRLVMSIKGCPNDWTRCDGTTETQKTCHFFKRLHQWEDKTIALSCPITCQSIFVLSLSFESFHVNPTIVVVMCIFQYLMWALSDYWSIVRSRQSCYQWQENWSMMDWCEPVEYKMVWLHEVLNQPYLQTCPSEKGYSVHHVVVQFQPAMCMETGTQPFIWWVHIQTQLVTNGMAENVPSWTHQS